jgi:uncharacterized protein (TIGR02246 family)
MNKLMCNLLCAVMLAVCSATARAGVEEDIRALEQQQVQFALAGDRKALEKLFAPDFRIINPAGAVANKEELLALLTASSAPYKSATYVTETVRRYRDVVVSTGLESVVPAQGAQAGQNVRRRITHVWEKRRGRWQLVLRHATVVAAP